MNEQLQLPPEQTDGTLGHQEAAARPEPPINDAAEAPPAPPHEGVIVTKDAEGNVYVEDAKTPGKPPLCFTPEEWNAFILGVKNNEFDIR